MARHKLIVALRVFIILLICALGIQAQPQGVLVNIMPVTYPWMTIEGDSSATSDSGLCVRVIITPTPGEGDPSVQTFSDGSWECYPNLERGIRYHVLAQVVRTSDQRVVASADTTFRVP